jgi:hypothetical protein
MRAYVRPLPVGVMFLALSVLGLLVARHQTPVYGVLCAHMTLPAGVGGGASLGGLRHCHGWTATRYDILRAATFVALAVGVILVAIGLVRSRRVTRLTT